jgi:2-hydroxy-3-keto-5-methylthiopentenyl-1-phosphate phosphatase
MPRIAERKELFTLLSSVCESNRSYFSRFGRWLQPQIKVFWLEINDQHVDSIIESSGMSRLDNALYEISFLDEVFWIDTSDKRIWQIFTLAETDKTNKMIREKFLKQRGADRIWLTENFMNGIRRRLNYNDRGFGIKFKDILTPDEDSSDFSAKFWIGKSSTEKQERFLGNAKETFSISSIRFGRRESLDKKALSGELYELYYSGHLTVTTSDDIENVVHVINTIRNSYKEQLIELEKQNNIKPTHVDINFSDCINTEGFDVITNTGVRQLKLWLQQYQKEDTITRYSGVDLHTGDFLYLDLADEYSYIFPSKNACMNVAPRFGTLTARYMSLSVQIFHDGVELFA